MNAPAGDSTASPKPSKREYLTFHAMAALREAVDACHDAPIRPGLGLRFALAYLFLESDRRRGAFDQFWAIIQNDMADCDQEHVRRYIRGRDAMSSLYPIARSLGFELNVTINQLLGRAQAECSPAERLAHVRAFGAAIDLLVRDGYAKPRWRRHAP